MSTERKMIGSYNGAGAVQAALDWIGEKIGNLFSRADDVEAEAERQADADIGAPGTALAVTTTRPSLNAEALRGALTTLQDHLERVTSEWERVQSDADTLKPKMDDMAAGIRAITENMDTQYADNTAVALTNRLSVYSEQWDALVAQAASLRTVVLEIQSQVQAVEQQIEGKAAELGMEHKGDVIMFPGGGGQSALIVSLIREAEPLAADGSELASLMLRSGVFVAAHGLQFNDRGDDPAAQLVRRADYLLNEASTGPRDPVEVALNEGLYAGMDAAVAQGKSAKAFYDPEGDEDRAALVERIDALATSVDRAIEDNDEDEQAELLAQLRDLNDGLTDDTRFRVQALIERLGGGEKSAPGAHLLYA